MRAIDEAAEVVGRAVEARRRVQAHAVVAPAEPSREVRDGHHLEHGDADVREGGQLAHRALPGSLARERADVQLVDDRAFERNAGPRPIGPGKRARVDHAGGPVRPLGLKARGRIGKRVAAVEAIAIEGTGSGVGDRAREVAVGFAPEADRTRRPRARSTVGSRSFARAAGRPAVEHDLDASMIGCPHPKVHAPLRRGFRAHGQAPPRIARDNGTSVRWAGRVLVVAHILPRTRGVGIRAANVAPRSMRLRSMRAARKAACAARAFRPAHVAPVRRRARGRRNVKNLHTAVVHAAAPRSPGGVSGAWCAARRRRRRDRACRLSCRSRRCCHRGDRVRCR